MVDNNIQKSDKHRNIYLIGFMGVGKSAVARKLAYKLKMFFIDSDREIEKLSGKSINDIFKEENGEQNFRQLERQFIESGHPHNNCVIACGGGLPIAPGMIELLKSKGVVIALFAKSNTILERTNRRETRPLLKVDDKQEYINNLQIFREKIYQKADYLIFSENRPIDSVASDIVRIYRSLNSRFTSQNAHS